MIRMLDQAGLNDNEDLINEYKEKYNEICGDYVRLGKSLNQDIKKLIDDENIDILDVNHRIKELNKFLEKIHRKEYDKPFEDINDICGLRIICYYTSDLEKIYSLIENEFDVLEIVDKADLLKEDRFGYLSRHYIVKIKNTWLKTPIYRDLGDLVVEIQVRTILQHAWADISHKLVYKKEEQIPSQFKRRLNSISCILENSDIQFDSLRDDRGKYVGEMSGKALESGKFDVEQEFNLDSLQAFLNFYFPNRKKDIIETSELLDEILTFNKEFGKEISFKYILEAYEKSKEYIKIEEVSLFKDMVTEDVEKLKEDDPQEFEKIAENCDFFLQVGIIRTALVYHDSEYKEYWGKVADDELEEILS